MDLSFALFCTAAAVFALGGFFIARRSRNDFETHFSVRNSVPAGFAFSTVLASAMGAWILFSPPSSAIFSGLGTVVGYAVGSMLPLLLFVPLGDRLKTLMPAGYSLTGYVGRRYGRSMHALVLALSVAYPLVFLCAEVTAVAKLMEMLAGVDYWITAFVILATASAYTWAAGLKASIYTDVLQLGLFLPVLAATVYAFFLFVPDTGAIVERLRTDHPHLIDAFGFAGITGGITLVLAVLSAEIFNQANWQRVYASKDRKSMVTAFMGSGFAMFCVILLMGLVGLAAWVSVPVDDPEMALFAVIADRLPASLLVAVALMTLALVLSSADSLLNAIASLIAVDGCDFAGVRNERVRFRSSRIALISTVLIAWLVASQGFGVFYMFLVVDLFCCTFAYPVFAGLFDSRLDGKVCVKAVVCGVLCGLPLFPFPDFSGNLLNSLGVPSPDWLQSAGLFWSFLAALSAPVTVCLLFGRGKSSRFDFSTLR